MTEPDSFDRMATAIRDHVAHTADGAYLTDWVLVAAAVDARHANATNYLLRASDGPIHHKVGLIQYMQEYSDWHDHTDDDEDGDQ